MAFISLLAFAVVVGILAVAKYIGTAKKNRLPPGIQKLPGPKGNEHDLDQPAHQITRL
jgi:outer membrane murein-binding lipoprotein Lpp